MCFKKPKAPKQTAAEKAAELEQQQATEAAKAEAARRLAEEKQKRLEEGAVRASGQYGVRSLISGRKGGGGFLRSLLG